MKRSLLLLTAILLSRAVISQPPVPAFRMMFWNTENFYDTYNDSLVDDEEFLPGSSRYWTPKRYRTKLQHAFKVIVAVGESEPPAIVGLSEIENRKVLLDLIYSTPLQKFAYGIVHRESPDRRGIDVALLYRKDCFKPLREEWLRVNFPDHPHETTREILYVVGVTGSPPNSPIKGEHISSDQNHLEGKPLLADTLHLFINHWPSRSSGQSATDHKRMIAACMLRAKIDSLLAQRPEAKIVIMGDFNDEPTDASLQEGLAACLLPAADSCSLVNLSSGFMQGGRTGTHKYQGNWAVLDQFIVSRGLMQARSGLGLDASNVHIFAADFLLVEDASGLGRRPFRTYDGFRYAGGFSDHLPVYLDLIPQQ